jgi:serine/threonine-protein kinase
VRFCGVCGAAFRSTRTCPRDGVALEASASDPFVGRVLGGRYRVLDRVGAGGMGQVYRAAHTRIACTFAVKVVWGDLAYDPAVQARFAREAEVASCLQSRHIVRVVDFATDEGTAPYLVMEYLDGPTLLDVLRRERALRPGRAIRIAQRIALGLAHAHDRGVVHRDLKPENVVLVREDEEDDVVKLLDFGVARLADAERLTVGGIALGTPLYMAPEQVRGQPVDGRTDLYALGVLLVEMLTGAPPFDAPVLEDLLRAQLSASPPSLRALLGASGAAPEIDDVVQRLLAKRPDDRFGSAREVVQALAAAATPAPPSRAASANEPRPARAAPVVLEAIERAILVGAPLYNAGDHAGCHEVYRREALRLVDEGAVAGLIAARLRDGLARAAARASATDAAWDMRRALDDVLLPGALEAWEAARATAGPRPAPGADAALAGTGGPTRLAPLVLRADVRESLERAIGVGAPAYNEGRHDVCARVYREAAAAIVARATLDAGIQPVEQHLRRAIAAADGAASPGDAAWILRRAFDAVLTLD